MASVHTADVLAADAAKVADDTKVVAELDGRPPTDADESLNSGLLEV